MRCARCVRESPVCSEKGGSPLNIPDFTVSNRERELFMPTPSHPSEKQNASDRGDDLVYSVAAVIDLQGFAAHLETGANDLRTTIGKEAITRLGFLDAARKLVETEAAELPPAYPRSLHISRINDALILHLDLPDRLRPSVGQTARSGYTVFEMEEYFEIDRYLDDDDDGKRFSADVAATLESDVTDLIRFVGLVARLHQFVNAREWEAQFPGAKTICASGYRRHYITSDGSEDRLAANFAFANAQVADQFLHGPRLFLDDNITKLLCINRFARNLVRHACFVGSDAAFDPTTDPTDGFYTSCSVELSVPERVHLFRAPFDYRRLNPAPLTFLQLLPELTPFLDGSKEPAKSIFMSVRKTLQNGPDVEMMRKGIHSSRLLYPLDFGLSLLEFLEITELGESPSRDKKHLAEMIANATRVPAKSTS